MVDLGECSGDLSQGASIALAVLNAVFAVLATGGNTVVLLAIYRTPSLRTISNYFLVSLAVSDLAVGAVVHPVYVVRSWYNYWFNEHPVAKASEILAIQTFTATSFGLCAISVDRYVAVTKVYRYHGIVTLQRCVTSILLIWMGSIAYPFIRFVTTDPQELPKLWMSASTVSVGVPFAIIAYCYFYIFKAVRDQRRKIACNTISPQEAQEMARNHKGARTVAIVIGLVLLFWMPGVVISVVQLFMDPCMTTKMLRVWFWGIFCSLANSSVNPWVYAVRSKEIRRAMKKILLCQN